MEQISNKLTQKNATRLIVFLFGVVMYLPALGISLFFFSGIPAAVLFRGPDSIIFLVLLAFPGILLFWITKAIKNNKMISLSIAVIFFLAYGTLIVLSSRAIYNSYFNYNYGVFTDVSF